MPRLRSAPPGSRTVQQCFHLLNNFDIPIGIEHPEGEVSGHSERHAVDLGQIDLTNRRVYYKTAYNNTIRCIDLAGSTSGKRGLSVPSAGPETGTARGTIAVPE